MGDLVGQQLGNYRLRRLLGQGSFADVYLGEHIHLGTQAAIKVLQVRLVENNVQSFLTEARTIAHLIHPYIIRVLDFGVHHNTPFLVMDYAPKGTFRQRFLRLGKPLPPAPLVSYMRQTAAALQYAHDHKLIHRDVKPENMLMGPNDEVLLSDFGFAVTAQSSSSHSLSEKAAGTASYMAPEQLQRKPRPASDQYALGVIAYEWLCGSRPFEGSFLEIASQQVLAQPPFLHDKVPTIAREIEDVVMTALAKDPHKRFANVRDFALALEEACLLAQQYDFALPSIPPVSDKIATPRIPPVSDKIATPPSKDAAAKAQPSFTAQSPMLNIEMKQGDQSMQQMAQMHTKQGGTSFRSHTFPTSQSSLSNLPAFSSGQSSLSNPPAFSSDQSSLSNLPAFSSDQSSLSNLPAFSSDQSSLSNLPAFSSDQSSLSNLPAFSSDQSSPATPQKHVAEKRPAFVRQVLPHANIILFTTLLVVVIGSVGLLYVVNSNAIGSGSLFTNDATGNSKYATLSTADVSATATNTLKDPYASYAGVLALNDPLDNDQYNQWNETNGPAAGMFCQFMQNGYHVAAPPDVANTCFAKNTAFNNFAYEVSMHFVKTATQYSSAGITFRANQNTEQYYRFGVYASGRYSLDVCTNKVCTIVVDGEAGAPLSSFNMSSSGVYPLNTIAVVARNNTFAIYVNDQLVFAPFTDTNVISTEGMIGVFVGGGVNTTTEAVFSNAHVWKLA